MPTNVTYPGIGVAMDANLATAIAAAMAADKILVVPANANDWTIDGPAGNAELAVNGTMAVDANWNKGTGWTISGGAAHAAAGSASDLGAAVAPLTNGKRYRVQFTISNFTGGTFTAKCGTALGTARGANGTFQELIIANGTAFAISKSSAGAGDIDNVSFIEDSPRFAITMQTGMQLQIDGNILGRAGNFLGFRDCVIGADKVDNWRIYGSGSVRMGGVAQFGTYASPVAPYNSVMPPSGPSEFRHICSVRGCQNWKINGTLSFNSSGGDGLYLGATEHNLDQLHTPNQDFEVSNLNCQGNLRQGISFLSGRRGKFYDVVTPQTLGVAPQSGIDVEPEFDNLNALPDYVDDIEFIRPISKGNPSRDFFMNLDRMRAASPPIYLTYTDLLSTLVGGTEPWGFNYKLSAGGEGPPGGRIVVNRGRVENLRYAGIRVDWKFESNVILEFRGFSLYNVSTLRADSPIDLVFSGDPAAASTGGIFFNDVYIDEFVYRNIVSISPNPLSAISNRVYGRIIVIPHGFVPGVVQSIPSLPRLSIVYQQNPGSIGQLGHLMQKHIARGQDHGRR